MMRKLLVLAGFCLSALSATAASRQVIDNPRVTVWDVTLASGESAPPTPMDLDTVTLILEGGTIKTVKGGASVTAARDFGDAIFTAKGSDAVDTALNGPVHEVVIALKGGAAPSSPSPPGMPNAFPRDGAQKMFENDRAIAWKFSWTPGVAVPMHHHDKDTVMVFRYDGPIRSTNPKGEVSILPFGRGEIRFSPAGTTHTELLAGERQSAADLELK
jgi:hypothetical protein